MILITENVDGDEYDALGAHHGLVRDPEAWHSPARLAALRGTDVEAVIVRNRTQVDAGFLDLFPELKVIGRAGVGLDNIDLDATSERGIPVVVPSGANAVSVAEHALTLALALSKNLIASDLSTRSGSWNRQPNRELGGLTWGLISVGATGRATARVVRCLGMRVLGYDPYLAPGDPRIRGLGVELMDLDPVLAASDVVSVHLPATPSTERMMGQRQFALMKPGALFINVGRGEVVDEPALARALASGHLGGAGLDVRATEPPVGGELQSAPNVILTPHVAGITRQSQSRIAKIVCEQVSAILSGVEPNARYLAGVREAAARSSSEAVEAQ